MRVDWNLSAVARAVLQISIFLETTSWSFTKCSARVGAPEEFNLVIVFERFTVPADFELSGGLDSQTRSVHDGRYSNKENFSVSCS